MKDKREITFMESALLILVIILAIWCSILTIHVNDLKHRLNRDCYDITEATEAAEDTEKR